MLISRARWVRLSLILLASALIVPFWIASASAQSAKSVHVESSTATSNFPSDMTFELSASVSGKIQKVDLVYQESSLETLELLPGDFQQDNDRLTATAKADLATYFVPAGIDLTYHWVVTFADDSVQETGASVVTWIDNRFEWDKREGTGVEVYSYDRSDTFMDFVMDTTNKAVQDMIALYNPPKVLPIRIWLYQSGKDFAGTQAANSQEWAAGAAYPSLQVILAVIPKNSKSEVNRVLPHEISHQILAQATVNPYNAPATWIDEGLAVVAQIGGKDHYEGEVRDAYEKGELLSLRSLISSFPYDPSQASIAYGESYLVMQYILDQYGPESIQAIITAYREGSSQDDVIQKALGMSMEELEQAWLRQFGSSIFDKLAA
jgi:peptidase MA superfamily protein